MGKSEERKERKRARSYSPSESRSRRHRDSREKDSRRRESSRHSRSPASRSKSPSHKSRRTHDRSVDRSEERDRREREKYRDRSRERERHRDRGRDKDRRDRDRDRDRDRERDRKDRDKDKQNRKERELDREGRERRGKDAEGVKEKRESSSATSEIDSKSLEEKQREAENAALEEEMRKRRERVRAWQEAKAKKLAEEQSRVGDQATTLTTVKEAVSTNEEEQANETVPPAKDHTWTLEDEEEDEEDNAVANTREVEEIVDVAAIERLPSVIRTSLDDEEDVPSKFPVIAPLSSSDTVIAAKSNASNKKPLNKPKSSRWGVEASVERKDDEASKNAMDVEGDSELDPLDAFMSSLYGSGEVAAQKELRSLTQVTSLGAADAPSQSSVPSGNALTSTATDLSHHEEMEEDDLESKINSYGSNIITLDEILGGLNGGASVPEHPQSEEEPSQEYKLHRGWESESELLTPSIASKKVTSFFSETAEARENSEGKEETEAEREAREEREHQEFIAAIRRAREEEDRARERMIKLGEELSRRDQTLAEEKTSTKKGNREEELGRVFAEEGDILDEYEVAEKKRSALELLEEAKRGKVLKEVDHSKISYLPFRKNLYIVPKALAKLTEADVLQKRDRLQVRVRGKECPAPVDSWEQCGLSARLLASIYEHRLKEPFPIQKQAIPAIMCGRDVIGVAKTGSGKTLAFLLPMFRHIQDQPPLQDNEGPIGLIMAPARELATQIYSEARKFMKVLGLRVACIYGGAGVAEQIADLKRGSEIVVCTPGRMIDILCMQAGKLVSLKRVTMVVLDEADRMFDMGFEPQIRMILQNIRPDRQTVMFSATFPKAIEKLAKTILRFPLEIVVGERSTVNKDITQYVEIHEEEDKFLRLLQLLGVWYEKGSILVFVDKQEKCDQLFHELLKLGYPCLSLHGGKDQIDRDHTLHEFKTGVKTVMIATSVAGRGLDVPEIVCVINYNCPNHLEDYVHRVGRTGRAGRKGTAYTFISAKEDQYAPIMVKALMKAGQPVPAEIEALATSFKEKVERGEAKWSSNGFVGKGFTFDASEMNEAQRAAMLQKKAYEIEEGLVADKNEEADDEDDDLYDNQNEVDLSAAMATTSKSSVVSSSVFAPVQMSTEASSSTTIDPKVALARAKIIAMQLATGKKIGEDYYSEELDINDYPLQARKKVTNRNALDDVTERTGVAIVSRGIFVAPGKNPPPGERRLHLLIEGTTEMSVRQAKMEIQRALEEETIKVGLGNPSGATSGRYSVI